MPTYVKLLGFHLQTFSAVLISISLVIFRPSWLSLEESVWIVVPVFAALLVWIVYFYDTKRPPAPIFEVTVTFYAIAYGLSTYVLELGFVHEGNIRLFRLYDIIFFDPRNLIDKPAIFFAAIGTLLLLAGYYGTRYGLRNRFPTFTLPEIKNNNLLILIWGLLIGHSAYLVFPIVQQLPSIGQFLIPSGYVAFGVFFVLWHQNRISSIQAAIIGLICLPISIWFKISGGSLTPITLLGLFFFFLLYRLHGSFPWKIAAISALFVIMLYPAIPIYRALTWDGNNSAIKTFSNPTKVINTLEVYYNKKPFKNRVRDNMASITKRIGLGVLFSYITKKTPEEIPFWNGHTFTPILTSFIPRVFWPGKPEERIGYEFRERYNFIFSKTNTTVVNIPWLVEFYVNFGHWGVYIGMVLNGIFLAFLNQFFNHRKMKSLEAVIGLAIIFPLAYQEANFSVITGSVLMLAIAMWCYFYLGQKILQFGSRAFSR